MKFIVASTIISFALAAPTLQTISGKDTIIAGPIGGFSGSRFFDRRGFVQGLGLLGGNGNSNEDTSQSTNIIAHGNQQLSGTDINNSPILNTGGVTTTHTISG